MLPKRLADLDFMDLYLCLDSDQAAYYHASLAGSVEPLCHDLPLEYHEDLDHLRFFLNREMTSQREASLTWNGLRLRASKSPTLYGQNWVALRRIPATPLAVGELGFRGGIPALLQTLGKRDGLIVVCGSAAQGKTTTACSLLCDYLDRYGGMAVTIEDPVEYQLEGRYGAGGLCFQMEARKGHDWSVHLKHALRWHPRYIFAGELRAPDAANQLLRMATSGHLVITTIHAGSLQEGLEGLLHLAEQAIGGHAPILLAAGLTAIIHQRWTSYGVVPHLVTTEADNTGDPVRALIRDRHIGQIATLVDRQMGQLMKGA